MIKNITINITEPICKCEVQNLAWDCLSVPNIFVVHCLVCKTQLQVKIKESLVAHFKLDKLYPKSKEEYIEENLPDNVIPFRRK